MALLLCATPFLVFTGPSATRWHELATYSFEDYKAEFGKVYATAEEEVPLDSQADGWMEGSNEHTQHSSMMLGASQPIRQCAPSILCKHPGTPQGELR